MHPVLFRIPLPELTLPLVGKLSSIPIYSYGVMLGLSLVVGWYLTLGLAEKEGMDRERRSAGCGGSEEVKEVGEGEGGRKEEE